MAAEAADSNIGQLGLTPDETRVYRQLFRQADPDNVGVVTGQVAVPFFERTRLDPGLLGQIWQVADKGNLGFLNMRGFAMALRLIGHAQAGRPPTADLVAQQAPLPKFDGFTPTGAGVAPGQGPVPVLVPVPGQGQGQGPAQGIASQQTAMPPLTPEKVAQYTSLFERQALRGGQLPSEQAEQIFRRSGVKDEALHKIWQLADTEQRGSLVLTEFIIAMHLVSSIKWGTLRALPNILPAALYEAATRQPAAARQSPVSTGPATANPRQLTGSSSFRAGSPLGPPHGPPPHGPLGQPLGPLGSLGQPTTTLPTGAGGGGGGSGGGSNSGSATATGEDWLVSAPDKIRFDQIFDDLDKDRKGFVSGEVAALFLSQSALKDDILARIWDLSDINADGCLNRDEFAVAMYLIRQQRRDSGVPMPSVLPPGLVPPSMRVQARPAPARPATANSVFGPSPPRQQRQQQQQQPPSLPLQQPPLAAKSAMDDLFGLESASPSSPSSPPAVSAAVPVVIHSMPPATPTTAQFQVPLPTGNSAAGSDPFAGGVSALRTGSPPRSSPTTTTFKPFVPSSSFGRTLATHATGDSSAAMSEPQMPSSSMSEDLLGDNDPEISKKLTNDTTELANLSNQVGSLSRQMLEVQAQRTSTQNELGQAAAQKKNFEQRLAQLRALYEKEAQDMRALDEQLAAARKDTARLQSESASLETAYQGVQTQHREVLAGLQADQRENAGLRDRIRAVGSEITQLRTQIEKLRSEARQQKGMVAINKKQLTTSEGERDRLKIEMDGMLQRTNVTAEDAPWQQARTDSPVSTMSSGGGAGGMANGPLSSPAASAASANNPFFRRTGSTDITAVFSSPSPKPGLDKTIDDMFGSSPFQAARSTATPPPPPPTTFSHQHTGASVASQGSMSMPTTSARPASRQATVTPEEPSVSSSSESRDAASASSTEKYSTPPVGPADAASTPTDRVANTSPVAAAAVIATADSDGFATADPAKAKVDFDKAFASFGKIKSARDAPGSSSADLSRSVSAFDAEFPPISKLERGGSDSDSDRGGGFDDDFAPASPPPKRGSANGGLPTAAPIAPEVPEVPEAHGGEDGAGAGAGESHRRFVPGPTAQPRAVVNYGGSEDDFDGLEDAKEGSADDDFATISRSGLDDFNPVFDSSPPASQVKSEVGTFSSTDPSFDFVSSASSGQPFTAAPVPRNAGGSAAVQTADSQDWDAIFASLDSPSQATVKPMSEPQTAVETEHDDPMLKNLTGMGYARADALKALEKYDYNIDQAANHLASHDQS